MSQITFCDVCETERVERRGLKMRLKTAGEVHPHKGEALPPRVVDVCEGCLDLMLGFFVFPELDGLRRMVGRLRAEAEGGDDV
jgi:hypothetical protein